MERYKSYYEYVRKGMDLLLRTLAPFVGDEMRRRFGASYWWQFVLNAAPGYAKNFLPAGGEDSYLESKMDIELCLDMIDRYWKEVFQERLRIKDYRTYTNELIGVRNNISHMGSTDLDQGYAERALDTMHRLCVRIDVEAAEDIKNLYKEVRASAVHAPATPVTPVPTTPVPGALPSWRDVMVPHDEVADGSYKKAEFAADLSQVAKGKGTREYRDPKEFFARTYVTEGMKNLLTGALERVKGDHDGEPVIQLKTAFGGGKTHSMLALYHLMKHSDVITADNTPNLREVFDEVGIDCAPKVNVATFVGSAENPAEWKRPKDFPGITINTIWGNIAYQLAKSAGKPEAYDIVKESDKKGISPGSDAFASLFDMCGPCLILIDELVAYGRKIYRPEEKDVDLPAGTFENFTTFVQELTEGAKKSKNSLVVASIPESATEIGKEGGQETLKTIEHYFNRLVTIWKPVTAEEGYEIVRRRLFHECAQDKVALRNHICEEFSKMYRDNPNEFPAEAHELNYRDKMAKCYPIHPEIFDRLYSDWSTLENFQRTRGVLRFMAAVIHELWSESDASPMIMPGSIPIGKSTVSDELIKYLPGNWNAIVDRDVDGSGSVPRQIDNSITRFGQIFAAQRVARTIMLGSAPSDKRQKEAVRGIAKTNVKLGVSLPGQNISTYSDVLNDELLRKLIYLYSNQTNDRFWYDTRPSLRKTAEDRAKQQGDIEVGEEIKRRLKKQLHIENPFCGIHICPASPSDVADDQCARLVVLGIGDDCKTGTNIGVSRAQIKAQEIYGSSRKEKDSGGRDSSIPRIYKNMLVFVAPDSDGIPGLTDAVKVYLAWKSIKDDSYTLNLDAQQNKEADNCIKNADSTVNATMCRVWQYILVPTTKADDLKGVKWNIQKMGDADGIMKKVLLFVERNEAVIDSWAPFVLKSELDKVLWKDSNHIQIRKLWDDLCSYCYLPRLSKYDVLERCIREGLPSGEYFALAAGIDEDGKYVDLRFKETVSTINKSDYLVKLSAVPQDYNKQDEQNKPVGPVPVEPGPVKPRAETPKNRRYTMTANINKLRGIRDFGEIFENIIEQLNSDEGCSVTIKLDVEAKNEKGIPIDIVRAIKENCDTLNRGTKNGDKPKIEYSKFED